MDWTPVSSVFESNTSAYYGLSSAEALPAVVIDRFYSSVLLALEFYKMQVYVIGTIMTNRLGYDVKVKVEGHSTRPASIPRGTFTLSRSMAVPTMVAFHWWDRKPLHYLCTGTGMSESSVGRKVKRVGAITAPLSGAGADHQRWMGALMYTINSAFSHTRCRCRLSSSSITRVWGWLTSRW
ncbi:unnamed protein product [Phytophthora fragariaefolia]|uniref:Unnamed protein product n=1 Tax=Phytophthora fragariaefolia TaxID=1490495 RepID=A0A9W7DCG3_9STRA|nr:unnamed protein product [Phytophthora fragariaefolia]